MEGGVITLNVYLNIKINVLIINSFNYFATGLNLLSLEELIIYIVSVEIANQYPIKLFKAMSIIYF